MDVIEKSFFSEHFCYINMCDGGEGSGRGGSRSTPLFFIIFVSGGWPNMTLFIYVTIYFYVLLCTLVKASVSRIPGPPSQEAASSSFTVFEQGHIISFFWSFFIVFVSFFGCNNVIKFIRVLFPFWDFFTLDRAFPPYKGFFGL